MKNKIPTQIRPRLVAALLAGSLGLASAAHATPVELIVNGGFESGTFAGWTTHSTGGNNQFYVIANGGNVPASGLPTAFNPTGGTRAAVSDQTGSGGEELLQTFTKTAGMTSLLLSFDWFDNTHTAYIGTAINGSQQAGRVDILNAGTPAFSIASVPMNLLLNAGTVTPYGTTIPWTHSSFDLSGLSAGTYELRFGNGQCCYFQEFGVDNVSLLANSVPEPVSGGMAALGLAALGWSRRKRTS